MQKSITNLLTLNNSCEVSNDEGSFKQNFIKPEVFEWRHESDSLYKLLGNKNRFFRRMLMQKNVEVQMFPEEGVSEHIWRWVAKGKNKQVIFRGLMPSSTYIKRREVANKAITKKILSEYGVKVPSGIAFEAKELDKAISWFERLNRKKVVVKPVGGSGGLGVVPGIIDSKTLKETIVTGKSVKYVIEEHLDGFDHRLLVVGGKVIAVMRRWPAQITGDGQLTIKELIEQKNEIRLQCPFARMYMMRVNDFAIKRLAEFGLTLQSIIPAEETITLQAVSNIGAGGEGEDLTDYVHQGFIDEAVKCGEAFGGLEFYGVDLIAEDISKSPKSQGYGVIELNLNPGVCMHHWPSVGQGLNVIKTMADYYFPEDDLQTDFAVAANIKGTVQGVGFRAWLLRQAVLHGVNGSCKNLEDGSVELFMEGSRFSINTILKMCARGPKRAEVQSVVFKEIEPKGVPMFSIA